MTNESEESRRWPHQVWRETELELTDPNEITLMSPGDILVLYTDGVYDGSNREGRDQLEAVMREHYQEPAKEICNALLDHAVKQDEQLRRNGGTGT